MKKLSLTLLSIFLLVSFAGVEKADAQWSLGAAYEIRSEDPTNGFGIRMERQILSAVPVVDFGMRTHFSYFSDKNSVTRESVTYDQDFESYDFGLATYATVGVGLLKPYLGVGVGMDQSSLEDGSDRSFEEMDFYYNAFFGSEIRFPVISPFIEYRFTKVTDRENIDLDNISRLAIGLSLRF